MCVCVFSAEPSVPSRVLADFLHREELEFIGLQLQLQLQLEVW